MYRIIVAIDGFSSCGKSTTARKVAENLGYAYVDTGAMYRAVTLYFLGHHVTPTNPKEVSAALAGISITFRRNPHNQANETFLNGLNVESEIRKMHISEQVSQVSAIPEVRKAMVAQQQLMGRAKGLVMDGRDIGSVVFPKAELKVFMTADPLIRAQRRQAELLAKGEMVELQEILENLQKRDLLDTTRTESPLVRAEDAILLDNSFLTFGEQVDLVTGWADTRIARLSRLEEIHRKNL
ncbi:MAG: cytidylate kinase [Cytophagaceae bacterium SCN 52-12]|nr:MAG: cytidylate kinase [Cytophagaceae bacterium SCN 52-12]